ncbi:MAG: TetR/AcrR family transcriptional regulator [Pseudomonadota bacterium]
MARPDIKESRREQIIDAFEFCVARYGVEGATLAKTAEQAGLARPLVRHNVGNRDDLVDALTKRFLKRSREAMDSFLAALPKEKRSETAIEWLFDTQYSDDHQVQVSYALITHSYDDTKLAVSMQNWLDDFISKLDELLAEDFPEAEPSKVTAVSNGIAGIYFNVESMKGLGNIESLLASSKKAAFILLHSLKNSK